MLLQARFFVSSLTGGFNLPSKEDMKLDVENYIKTKLENGSKMKYIHKLENHREYCEDLAKIAHIKTIPNVVHNIYASLLERRNRSDCFKVIDDDNYERSNCGT